MDIYNIFVVVVSVIVFLVVIRFKFVRVLWKSKTFWDNSAAAEIIDLLPDPAKHEENCKKVDTFLN